MSPTTADETGDDTDGVGERFLRVSRLWRAGTRISAYAEIFATVREVRLVDNDAVLIFDWPDQPKPFGLHIDLLDTSREFYYGDPVESFDDWIEYLDVYVMVSLGTGVTNRASHADYGDYVGIRESGF